MLDEAAKDLILRVLKLRFYQLLRIFLEIGIFRTLFLLLVILLAFAFMADQMIKVPNNWVVAGVYWCGLLGIQLKRPDKLFLKVHFEYYRRILFAEYFLLLLPLLIMAVYYGYGVMCLILPASLFLLVGLDVRKEVANLNTRLQQYIPSDCFEWKKGVRKYLYVIIALWLIGMLASFWIGTVPVVMVVLGVLTVGFYEGNEPVLMVLLFEKNAGSFLWTKIKLPVCLFTILTLPLILLFLIFNAGLWYIPLVIYIIFLSLTVYVILLKYAFYRPVQSSGAVQLFSALGILGVFIPVLLPVVWLMSVYFYFRALANLNLYLDDYN